MFVRICIGDWKIHETDGTGLILVPRILTAAGLCIQTEICSKHEMILLI